MIKPFRKIMPVINSTVFVADTAVIIGNVKIGEKSSVFDNAVIRGDENKIVIGDYTNIQDNCTLHNDLIYPLTIGNYVTIGHNAVVHGATIGNNVLIGMGAIILDGAVIEDNVIIGAGTVVTSNKRIEKNSVAVGNPFKVIRETNQKDSDYITNNAKLYSELSLIYKEKE